jgi:hypothetical protein
MKESLLAFNYVSQLYEGIVGGSARREKRGTWNYALCYES